MKFKVGDRVKYVNGNGGEYFGSVISVHESLTNPYGVRLDNGYTEFYSDTDLLELIQPEVQEPVPGKFYKRAGNGEKLKFLMKAKYWLYEAEDGHILKYNPPPTLEPWVDEVVLPAVEIKRWAIVCVEDGITYGRGKVIAEFDTKTRAESYGATGEYLEIVELTGTLPERKQ